jgi:penicillin-binding protein A
VEVEKEKKKLKNKLPFRLNLLFFFVFVCFSLLIVRLGVVQIVKGEDFVNELNRTENLVIKESVPRGKIFDRDGRLIVDNVGQNAISYIKDQNTKQEEIKDVAVELAKYIEMSTDKLTERDLKDFWILTHEEEAKALLTEEELENEKLTYKDLYKLQLKRITPEKHLAEMTPQDKKVAAIFREMAKGYALTPQIVKNEKVTSKEAALVSEHLQDMPGVDVFTDWKREYPNGDTFRSILGNISSSEEGLPQDRLEYFTSRGYSLNDRVGKSQIEYQYEDVLAGEKTKTEYKVDKSGKVKEAEEISPGKSGKDLILTIDLELQEKVEEVIERELKAAKASGGGRFLDSAFVVMTNPGTGEVLAISGKKLKYENGGYKVDDYALGAFTSSYEVGSAVKGATVLAGYEMGVLQLGTRFKDEPLNLYQTPVKKSYSLALGSPNDIEALKKSSNVYMFKTAIRALGKEYTPGMKLPYDPGAFEEFRYYFNQFGLGVKTGIDLPNESSGLPGTDYRPGLLLDLSIGQYDTYTALQLAQYISTIANDGNRMKLQLVREIREPSPAKELGPVYKGFEPVTLNRIDMSEREIQQVQAGFKKVFQEQGGTAASYFSGSPYREYDLAGKTGTAQSFYYSMEEKKLYKDTPTYNLTLAGYSPSRDPEVAFSIVVPYVSSDKNTINKKIGQGIMKAYYDLKKGKIAEGSE